MNHYANLSTESLLNSLTELAMDLHWSWNHATDKVWRQLDPVLWELTHNPLIVLQSVSQNQIRQVLDDPIVREVVEELIQVKRQTAVAPAWFQKTFPGSPLTSVAFFSMEYMLSEALPIYSGGLGNVAGDHLKTASDLGIPVIGIGLLYQQGYTRQVIFEDGSQQYVAPFNDPGNLPITPLRNANGEWLRIEIKLPGYSVWLRSWKVQVGRVMLLLLDSNDIANFPVHRCITNELYGGGDKLRFLQELVLGIGGWRLLQVLGLRPEVCHLNEGHAAFVIVERALQFMEENKVPFDVALNVTRAGNIFTTHTAIGAGFDHFPSGMIEQFLGSFITERLKISIQEFLALGRQNADNHEEPFNSGFLAIRGSGNINGVSKLNSMVSRERLAFLFPRWPLDEVPVAHVTNGVHMPTWDSPEADQLWTEACGKDRWLGSLTNIEEDMQKVSDARLWALRSTGQQAFIAYIRNRYARQLAYIGRPMPEIEKAKGLFDPELLTLGFARRFVHYKRTNLLLHNPDRLRRILLNPEKPVQLVLAGKAHPDDLEGQQMIQEWIQFINKMGLEHRMVFLGDYDMLLTEHMVQGVDVWINTPQRPWEACGTSGMKVLVNGGLNLSELDGWWDEAYDPELGWAIGDRNDHNGDPDWDAREAEQVYDLLEHEIIPEFYDRDLSGIPVTWVNRIRKSMAKLTPRYSANRSVREYTEQFYLPAAAAYCKRAANNGALGTLLVEWKQKLAKSWETLQFGKLTIESKDDFHFFRVEVYLNELSPDDVWVELYAGGFNGALPVRKRMEPKKDQGNGKEALVYCAQVSSIRAASDFTPRIIPHHDILCIPLECSHILWQR